MDTRFEDCGIWLEPNNDSDNSYCLRVASYIHYNDTKKKRPFAFFLYKEHIKLRRLYEFHEAMRIAAKFRTRTHCGTFGDLEDENCKECGHPRGPSNTIETTGIIFNNRCKKCGSSNDPKWLLFDSGYCFNPCCTGFWGYAGMKQYLAL